MVYFTADWCVSCRVIERDVFDNGEVMAGLEAVDLIKVDVTQSTSQTQELMETYGVVGPPTMIFLSAASKEPSSSRLVGEMSAGQVLASLQRATTAL